MKAFVIHPLHNTGDATPNDPTDDKHDVSGAFAPEATEFVRLNQLDATVQTFDNLAGMPGRAKEFEAKLAVVPDGSLDVFAPVCHGWPAGIQFGFTNLNVARLGAGLAKKLAPEAKVVLYACLTASDDANGFLHRLGQELARNGRGDACLYGHTIKGHCTRNPMLKWAVGDAAPVWMFDPDSAEFAAWRRHMNAPGSTLRLRFPFMTADQIRAEIAGAPPKPPTARRST